MSACRIPPQAVYPNEALRAEIRGRCIVSFTVDAEGVPRDIVPDCTVRVFTAAARLKMDADVGSGDTLGLPLRFEIG